MTKWSDKIYYICPMDKNDFKIKFGTSSNDIDIETLISSLLNTSNIIQEVNRELGTEKKIEVKIKALEKGSFEIHIELVESVLSSLFSDAKISYASNIIGIVGGLFGFAKFLGGRRPSKLEQKGDSITVTNENGDVTIFKDTIVNIFNENEKVRSNIGKQFSRMYKNDEIQDFEIISYQNEILTHIDRQEFEQLSKVISHEVEEYEVEVLENEKLQILRPSFATHLKWDLVYKGTIISAKMMDEELLRSVDDGDHFSKGDLMVVDLEITKIYDPQFDAYMLTKDSYKILVFKEHIKSNRTGKLF